MGCPVAGEAEAIVVFLDFFPILLEFATSEEFCTGVKMNVIQKIDSAKPNISEIYIDQCMTND